MKRILSVFVVATLAVASALAQRRGGGPQVDLSHPVTITGQVVSFQAGVGEGTPTLVVKEPNASERVLVLGPYRFLQSQGFTAQTGDQVEAVAYPCTGCVGGLAVAQVKNLTRGVTLSLRDSDGRPLWVRSGGYGQAGNASGANRGFPGAGSGVMYGLCNGPDMSRITTYTGTVESVTGGFGQGMPAVTLNTTDDFVTIILSPFRVLRQADYLPAQGNQLQVLAAPVTLEDQELWVAIYLKDLTTGFELQLRDPVTGLALVGWRRR